MEAYQKILQDDSPAFGLPAHALRPFCAPTARPPCRLADAQILAPRLFALILIPSFLLSPLPLPSQRYQGLPSRPSFYPLIPLTTPNPTSLGLAASALYSSGVRPLIPPLCWALFPIKAPPLVRASVSTPPPPALFRLPPSLLGSAPGATFAGHGDSPLLPASPVFRTLRAVFRPWHRPPPPPRFFRLPPLPLAPAPGATLPRHGSRSPPHAPPAFRALSAVFSSRHRPCRPRSFFGSRPRHSALRPTPPSRGTSIALLPLRRQLPALPAPYLAPGIEPAAPPLPPALFRLPPPLLGPAPGATFTGYGDGTLPLASPASRALSAEYCPRHRPAAPTYNDVLFASTPAACLPAPHRLHARHCTGSRPRCLCARPAFTPLAVTL
ncbi:hypothetical protein B0H14DRAFT_3475105 [Mycena olivaceomarginata]|nr:hypothetical protein B0H14DRAFT_3475105 [Mycena olivaceomarginata]